MCLCPWPKWANEPLCRQKQAVVTAIRLQAHFPRSVRLVSIIAMGFACAVCLSVHLSHLLLSRITAVYCMCSLLFIKWCWQYPSTLVTRSGALIIDWIAYQLGSSSKQLMCNLMYGAGVYLVWPCQNDWCSSRGSNWTPPRYKVARYVLREMTCRGLRKYFVLTSIQS